MPTFEKRVKKVQVVQEVPVYMIELSKEEAIKLRELWGKSYALYFNGTVDPTNANKPSTKKYYDYLEELVTSFLREVDDESN